MEKISNLFEKALIAAIMAGMLGLGVITLVMGLAGVMFTMVKGGTLLLGYLAFCLAIWLILMLPYLKNL